MRKVLWNKGFCSKHGVRILVWRDDKATGIVRPESGDRDVWVHLSSVEGRGTRTSLDEGERVRVEYRHIEHGPSGRWHGDRVILLSSNQEEVMPFLPPKLLRCFHRGSQQC